MHQKNVSHCLFSDIMTNVSAEWVSVVHCCTSFTTSRINVVAHNNSSAGTGHASNTRRLPVAGKKWTLKNPCGYAAFWQGGGGSPWTPSPPPPLASLPCWSPACFTRCLSQDSESWRVLTTTSDVGNGGPRVIISLGTPIPMPDPMAHGQQDLQMWGPSTCFSCLLIADEVTSGGNGGRMRG